MNKNIELDLLEMLSLIVEVEFLMVLVKNFHLRYTYFVHIVLIEINLLDIDLIHEVDSKRKRKLKRIVFVFKRKMNSYSNKMKLFFN